ncbi:hypothetical protein [Pseudomonas lundensis]|uniref:hypothetical protein n=1 Tax=Pseudomonas lundensis TaxID=86185 RepID=UPI00089DC88A|nr:hypothetical protein [Pseudomonas lundensis]
MNIQGLDKAEVLAALFNGSQQLGMGFCDPRGDSAMTVETAREIVAVRTDFDYLYGRVMKIGIGGDEVRTDLYDRDNGQGAAERAIAHLVAEKAA